MRHILPLLCLSGFLPVALSAPHPAHHVYHLILTPKMWSDAQTYCKQKYDGLATVVTDNDWAALKKEQTRNMFSSPAWMGLYNDVLSWRWSLDNAALHWENWASSEPNNQYNKEACGALKTTGDWWDLNCATLQPFLCYNASSSSRFVGVNSEKSWPDAQAYCREHHTDLASSRTESDNLLLKTLVEAQGSSWFGLFRDSWKWSDQTNVTSINWAVGSPTDALGYCGSVTTDDINDAPCRAFLPFFCHTVLPMKVQEVLKLTILSDLSVTDPLLASSVLALIWQELRNYGIADNSTVRWGLQSDGSIFQEVVDETVTNGTRRSET